MTNQIELPTLYGTEKNGKIKMWSGTILEHPNLSTATIIFGQVDGKKQTIIREYKVGKNIGKKNETTPFQQCLSETTKKWKDKKEKEGYKEDKEDKEEKQHYPMLAQTYEPNTTKKKKNDIVYPCYVQPKLDGLRCLIYKNHDTIICQSRTGTRFTSIQHIINELIPFFESFPSIILDGELYTNQIPFEELAGMIKKKKIEKDQEKLCYIQYHIYDILSSFSFEQRFQFIQQNIHSFQFIFPVETILTDSKEQFKNYFSQFIEQGYEGIMLRNINGMYRENYRSYDLQKYKEFVEDEYTIIDYKEGDGRDKGTVIWICETNGKTFSVRPRGTIEIRKDFFKKGKEYIGKKLTVIFQELSEMGIPRFPVGKAIRDVY